MPTTAQRLIDEARRGCYPMFVRMCCDIIAQRGQYLKQGSIHETPQRLGGGKFPVIRTPAGPIQLEPDDFDVLIWRFWPPLPGDKKRAAS